MTLLTLGLFYGVLWSIICLTDYMSEGARCTVAKSTGYEFLHLSSWAMVLLSLVLGFAIALACPWLVGPRVGPHVYANVSLSDPPKLT